MRKRKINLEFGRYKDTGLLEKARTIIDSLKDNPRFPPPIEYLDGVITATETYNHALAASGNGQKSTTIKKKTRKDLESKLQQLGRYLQTKCRDDVAAMISTGFTVSKIRESQPLPPKPSGFTVKVVAPGRVKLKCSRIARATYNWEWREINEKNWQQKATTKASYTINDLESGKQYIFRVRATASKGTGPYSDELRSWVL
jgi:hypothetical protein